MFKIIFEKQALKDAKIIELSKLKEKVVELLLILKDNPFQYPPTFKKLKGDLVGAYSRRINEQHRLVYKVDVELKEVTIISM
jgi:Txe/YoeB family toxin of toxin-antitoxin system